MKYFKTEASRNAPRYIITQESFRLNTKEKYPFERVNSGGQLVAYGVCPHCLNPIQLVGMFHTTKIAPYGKHTGKSIQDMPEWNLLRYKYCPYAKDGKNQPKQNELLPQIDDGVIELYELLKAQFDRVVYIIQKELHICCSKSFWEKALNQFITNKMYSYPWLTEANLPYIFAYFGMQQNNCYAQEFEINAEIYNALKSYPGVKFEKIINKPNFERLINSGSGNFFKLVFRFTNHRQIAKPGEILEEAIEFNIDDNCNGKTIYKQTIKFNETYFMNLVNKKGNDDKRQKWLLDMAEECMPPLYPNS